MYTALMIAGGVALLVFATRHLREGLDRLFGAELGRWLGRVARNPFKAFFAGMGAAAITPSSTTMSMLAVDAVQAGHVTTRQMLVIMLGADVGLTLTVQLIALSIHAYAPIIILAGVLLTQFARRRAWRGTGQVILSMGLLFLGVHVIHEAAAAYAPGPDLLALLDIAGRHPIFIAATAAVLAIALQSSTATVGLILSLAAASGTRAGALPVTLALALPVVLGANVGVSVTTLLVGFSRVESRRLALANLLAKLVTAGLLVAVLPWVVDRLGATPGGLARQVANAHTGFNVLKALLVIPLIVPLCRLVEAWVPAPPAGDSRSFGPRHIQNGPFDGATLAMAQSAREVMFAAEIVRSMLEDLWRAIKTGDSDLIRRISDRDNQVDLLDAEVKKFLARVSSAQELDADDVQEQLRQLRYLSELEAIGDIIDKNLCRLAKKKIKLGVHFSPRDWGELDDFDAMVLENMLLADTAFQTRDRELADKLLRHKDHIDLQIRRLRDQHFAALSADDPADYERGAIQLDLLTNLKRINSHVSHVAYATIHGGDYASATVTPRG